VSSTVTSVCDLRHIENRETASMFHRTILWREVHA
jgi:hypothetical protein